MLLMFQNNSYREKQGILLMIPDRKGYHDKCKGRRFHHLTVKKITNIIKKNNIKR